MQFPILSLTVMRFIMNEDELNEYCDSLVKDLKSKKMGGLLVLVSKEGAATINMLPEWSVLQTKEDYIELHSSEGDTTASWLEKAEMTLYFLESIRQTCWVTGNITEKLYDKLKDVLENALNESKIQHNPTTVH